MSGTYKATGINLKGMPLGENDRLLTVLTREHGLIRAIAPGARKHQSTLRGRSGLFVVNQLLIAKGRSLDKIIQAESLDTYTGLSQDLRKLTAGQYLAELALYQALSDQPQEELFLLLNQYLQQIQQQPVTLTLFYLIQGVFQLLGTAGVAPRVAQCCLTQQPVQPVLSDPDWRAGFHAAAGGVVVLSALEQLNAEGAESTKNFNSAAASMPEFQNLADNEGRRERAIAPRPSAAAERSTAYPSTRSRPKPGGLAAQLTAADLFWLQQLVQPDPLSPEAIQQQSAALPKAISGFPWLSIERLLRHYAQYHFDRPIQSAALVDTCFAAYA